MPTDQHQAQETGDFGIQKKQAKELVIETANAIIRPWTVVIHAGDATTANFAMVRVFGFVHLTGMTIAGTGRQGNGVGGNAARIRQGCFGMTGQGEDGRRPTECGQRRLDTVQYNK